MAVGDLAPTGTTGHGIAIGANKLTGGTITATGTTTAAVLTHSAVASTFGHKVDGIRPTLLTTGTDAPTTFVDGFRVHLSFSESLGAVDHDKITIRANGADQPTSAAIENGVTVQVTLATALTTTATNITVALGAGAVEDVAGNGILARAATGVSNAVGVLNLDPAFPSTEDGLRSVPEDTQEGQNVGAPVSAEDPESDALTYSLSGTDAASFVIDSNGQLRVATGVQLDYEGKKTYRVTVQVTDGKDQDDLDDMDAIDDTQNVTITVTNVNEPPVVTGPSTASIAENSSSAVASYTAADPERDTTHVVGHDDNFWISDRGQLYFRSPRSFEDQETYDVTVTATDDDADDAMSGSLSVTITVENVEEPGVVTISPPRGWVDVTTVQRRPERRRRLHQRHDLAVGAVAQRQEQLDGYHERNVVQLHGSRCRRQPVPAGHRLLYGRAGQRQDGIRHAADACRRRQARGEHRADVYGDCAGHPQRFFGHVGRPERWLARQGHRYRPGRRPHLLAERGGRQRLRYRCGHRPDPDEGRPRQYGGGQLRRNGVRPRRLQRLLRTRLPPRDDTIGVTITVTAVAQRTSGGGGGGGGGGAPQNRSPEFTDGSRTDRSVAENTLAGAEIGEPVAATDREDDTLTYSLRGADAESFDIDPATGQLLTKAPLDHEAQAAYSVIVAVSDGKSSSGRDSDSRDDSITVTISVENVDEPGEVALSFLQPQVAVALTATLTDPDGGLAGVVWLWERSADQADWTEIDEAASDVYTPVIGDLSSYLRATASYEDGHGRGKSAGTVTGDPVLINTVPRFPGLAITIEVEEGSGDAESGGVGSPVAAADPGGDTLTYSLNGGDAAVFDIDASTGQLWSKAPLDYEAQANYTVVVSVRDSRDFNGDPDTAIDAAVTVTIAVVNVAEPGALILLSSEPRVGVPFAARLTDPDGVVGEVVWKWERSRDGNPWSSSWRAIGGAESSGLRAGGRRPGLLPAGHGVLRRRPRSGQEQTGDHGRSRQGERRPGVPGRPRWRVRAERGGEHGRGRGRGRSGRGHEPRQRRADLRAWRRRRGPVRHRRGHGADQGRGRDGAGLRGGAERLRGDRHCHGLIGRKRDHRRDHHGDRRGPDRQSQQLRRGQERSDRP